MDISFQTVVAGITGFFAIGSFFNSFHYSLRERLVKLEAENEARKSEQQKNETLLQTLNNTMSDLKNEVVKLQTILIK